MSNVQVSEKPRMRLRNAELVENRRSWQAPHRPTARQHEAYPQGSLAFFAPIEPIRQGLADMICVLAHGSRGARDTKAAGATCFVQRLRPTSAGLPSGLDEVSARIEESRSILDLEDDFDDEESVGYSEATWERAAEFVRRCALELYEAYGIPIAAPIIGPGPDGSIDIHWKTTSFELLVNVPVDPDSPVSFYGDDYGDQKIRGTLDATRFNRGLLLLLGASS